MKVALVHDHLCHMGGAERVLAVLHRMYPSAPIFTALVRRSALWPELRDADIRTFSDVATADVARLVEVTGASEARAAEWISAASAHV